MRILVGRIRNERDLSTRDRGRRFEDFFYIYYCCYFIVVIFLYGFYFGMNDCNLKIDISVVEVFGEK